MSPLWGAKRTWIKNTTRVGWKCRSDRISHLEVFRKLNENTPTRNSYFSKQFSEGIWRVDALIIAVDIKPLKNDRFLESHPAGDPRLTGDMPEWAKVKPGHYLARYGSRIL